MDPPARCFLSVLLLLCCQHACSNHDGCVPSEFAVVNYTCSFEDNFCAWRNNHNNDFDWRRGLAYPNYYLFAWMNAGGQARLESRRICSFVNDEYFLEFYYYITMGQSNICQLSVDLLGDNNVTNLLRTQDSTVDFTHFSRNIIFNDNFKIVFKAISLENVRRNCWIVITNVRLTHETVTKPTASTQPPTSMTTSTPHPGTSQTSAAPAAQTSQSATILSTPPPSTTPTTASTFVRTSTSAPPETSVTSSATAEQNLQTDAQSQAGPPAGAVICIVIGAVLLAVIVVVCTGVILLARRKASGRHVRLPWIFKNLFKHSSTAEPRNGVFAVGNSAYVSGDECTPVHEHPAKESRVHKGMKQKRGDTIEYELAAVIGSDGGYNTLDDVDLKAGRREQQSTGRTDVDGSKGSDYNKLSFQTPPSAAVKNTEDTYNHLQDQENVNVYNVPRGEDSEYALAANPDKLDAQLPANAAQNQHYVNVDSRGKPVPAVEADTDYNHLNIKTDHATVTERRNPPPDVYSHLDEAVHVQPSQQADEYNRVDFSGHPRVIGEADDDATYSHFDTPQS